MSGKSPYLLLLVATILWGGNFVIGKAVSSEIPPYTLAFMRWVLAFLLFIPFTLGKIKAEFPILKQHLKIIMAMALTGVAGFNTLLYVSLHYTSSINASLVNTSAPILISILSFLLVKEKLNRNQLLGIFLSLIGVFGIISKGSAQILTTLSFNFGDLLMVVAVIIWGLYSIWVKQYAKILPANSTFAVSMIFGILILSPFCFWELHTAAQPLVWTAGSIVAILYVGICASLIAFISWNTAVAQIGPVKSSIFLNFIPVFATIFAIIFIHESIALYQIFGGALVIIGVFLSSRRPKTNEIILAQHQNQAAKG